MSGLGFFGSTDAEPLWFFTFTAEMGFVVETSGDRFGIGVGAELKDHPSIFFDERNDKFSADFFDEEFFWMEFIGESGGELLGEKVDGLHRFVEKSDVEFSVFDGDFALNGFVFREFEDATAMGADFDFAMSEGDHGEREVAKDDGEDFFHGLVGDWAIGRLGRDWRRLGRMLCDRKHRRQLGSRLNRAKWR